MKLTKAKRSLVRLLGLMPRMAITRRDAKRHGMLDDFERVRRAKLIQPAGYEVSGATDDWLNSVEGRAALARPETTQSGESR